MKPYMPTQHDLKPAPAPSPAGETPIAALRNEDDARRCAAGVNHLSGHHEARVLETKGTIIFGRYPWVVMVKRTRGEPTDAIAYAKGFTDAVQEGVVLR